MASVYLHRAIDERLGATLATLAALVEDEPGGLEWEPDGRRPFTNQETGSDHVRWIVFDADSVEVDRSQNLADPAALIGPSSSRPDARGRPWRIVERRLRGTHPGEGGHAGRRLTSELRILAGLRLDPVEHTLRNLAISLILLSVGLWGVTALVGRRLCRRVLAPLTRMAMSARELGTDEPGRRLPVARTGDEMEDLASSFNGLLDRWHEALERQARFAGDASHQLRTPLTAVIGQVDVALRRDRSPAEYQRALTRVRDQSDRLRQIVEAPPFPRQGRRRGRAPFARDDRPGLMDHRADSPEVGRRRRRPHPLARARRRPDPRPGPPGAPRPGRRQPARQRPETMEIATFRSKSASIGSPAAWHYRSRIEGGGSGRPS